MSRLTKIKNLDEYDKPRKNKLALYQCSCGKQFKALKNNVNRGNTKSCGCLAIELMSKRTKTHGLTDSKVYRAWCSMKRRCYNKNDIQYKDYGGRGIRVCKKWKNSFEAFLADIGHPPTNKHSIDRIDNNKGYSLSNCKWSSQIEQTNNTRTNKYMELNGKTQSLSLWCREFNVPYKLVYKRLTRGWNLYDSLTKPSKRKYISNRSKK